MKYSFPCSADHEQDWQPYSVDPFFAICDDHTYINEYSFQLCRYVLDAGFSILINVFLNLNLMYSVDCSWTNQTFLIINLTAVPIAVFKEKSERV